MTRAQRVIIIGGGITGLAAAHSLQASGRALHITLLEQLPRLGGCIYTERDGGYVMEHGADVFVTHKPEGRDLCSRLGLSLQSPRQRRAYVKNTRGLVPLPNGFSGLVPTRLGPVLWSPLLSLRGKVRLMGERRVPPYRGDAEESIHDFFTRRFGQEAFANILAPLLGGVAGGDLSMLSLDAQLPHLRQMEQQHGSLLRAKRQKSRGSVLRSLEGGLSSLIDALAAHLKDTDIRTSAAARRVWRTGTQYQVLTGDGARHEADAILVAAPAYAAAKMLASLDAVLAAELAAIRYGAAIMVHLGFGPQAVPRDLDATGYIVAASAVRGAVACTWSSAKFSGRAPGRHALVRVVLARDRPDAVFAMDDKALVTLAREEVHDSLGIKAPPVLTRVHRWYHSLPRYTLGHRERCARIRAACQAHPGLELAGAAYGGAGIPDCIRSAQHAAEALLSERQDLYA